MLYRKYIIKDTENLEMVFKVYPNQDNMVVVDKDEIHLPLKNRIALNSLIIGMNTFMDGNTINKVTIKEGED